MKKRHVVMRRDGSERSSSVGRVRYRECMKNHAATIGGYAVDGCREFMAAAGDDGGSSAGLTCAACGCHRNFHRREGVDNETGS